MPAAHASSSTSWASASETVSMLAPPKASSQISRSVRPTFLKCIDSVSPGAPSVDAPALGVKEVDVLGLRGDVDRLPARRGVRALGAHDDSAQCAAIGM